MNKNPEFFTLKLQKNAQHPAGRGHPLSTPNPLTATGPPALLGQLPLLTIIMQQQQMFIL